MRHDQCAVDHIGRAGCRPGSVGVEDTAFGGIGESIPIDGDTFHQGDWTAGGDGVGRTPLQVTTGRQRSEIRRRGGDGDPVAPVELSGGRIGHAHGQGHNVAGYRVGPDKSVPVYDISCVLDHSQF